MPATASKYCSIEEQVNKYLEYLEVEKGSSPLTVRNYRHYLKKFCLWLMKENIRMNVSDINPEVVRQYRVYLSRQSDMKGGYLSRKTQGYYAIAIRSFLRWLIKNDFEVMSPDKIDLPKIEERQIKFLNGEHIDRLLNSPTLSTINGKRDKAILEMLFSTGLRVSELSKLNRDQIDLQRREFGIIGKGGKARVVFLSQRASGWLDNYLKSRSDHYKPLFIRHTKYSDPTKSDDSMRLTVRSIQRMIRGYSKKIRLPLTASPHMIRHSFATDLLMAGADIRSVQEMLGHKNIQTTQIYTHVTHKHLKDVYDNYHSKGNA